MPVNLNIYNEQILLNTHKCVNKQPIEPRLCRQKHVSKDVYMNIVFIAIFIAFLI